MKEFLENSIIEFLLVVVGLGMICVCVVPCSLFYEHSWGSSGGYSGVCHEFWWIFWVGLLGLGLLASSVLILAGMWYVFLPFVVPSVLILAGMWCLSEYSAAYLNDITTADNVTPDTLQEIYYPEEIGIYKFKAGTGGGYVQSEPTIMYPKVPFSKKLDFNFECHGNLVPRTCESCDDKYDCTEYDCSYMKYPDECPGYHVLSFAPLWARSAQSNGDPEHAAPAAILFQWRSFLMNSKQGVTDDWQSRPKPFKVEMCQQHTLCAVDIRVSCMKRKWDEWHAEGAGVGDVAYGVGNHNYAGPVSHSEAWSIVKEHAPELFTRLGKKPEDSTPVLWMPYEAKDAFEQFEPKIEDAQFQGVVAAYLLGISLGIPLVVTFLRTIMRCKDAFRTNHRDGSSSSSEHEDEEML